MPKHFLPFVDGKSLFQSNWEVLRKKYISEEIFLQTNSLQAKIAHSQVSELLPANIFIEPETKNQGPATGLAAAHLKKLGRGDEPFILIQVDDLRLPEEDFLRFLEVMESLSATTAKYITAGYVPDRIVMGVDYLLKGKLVGEDSSIPVYEIADYIDRTETKKINKYMNSGRLLVHTNHTTMTPNNLLKMYKKYRPEWYHPLEKISKGADVEKEFSKITKGTLEEISRQNHKDGNSLVVIHPFKWIDFGTWEFVDKFFRENGYYMKNGGQVQIDGADNFLWSDSGRILATIGVSDLIVVESGEGILITTKSQSGKVGNIVEKINSGDV